MKIKHLLLFGLVATFSSCSTAYRTGQTPDDVYYSPAPSQDTYVNSQNEDERNSYYNRNEDMEIRRGIQNPRYRGSLSIGIGYGYPYAYDPFGYSYSPYAYPYNPYTYNPYAYKGIYDPYGYNYYGYNPYNYGYFNYGYSPYYGGYYPPVYLYPGVGNINTNTGPRKVNLGGYNNANNRVYSSPNSAPVRTFNQPKQGTGVGNVIRRVFSPSNSDSRSYNPSNHRNNSSDNSSNNSPSRVFQNNNNNNSSQGSSSPSSGSNSGSAPVRTFRK